MAYLLVRIVDTVLYVLSVLIFIRVIITWLPVNRYSKWVKVVNTLTDPIMTPFEYFIRKYNLYFMNLDISPVLALAFLQFIVQPILIRVILFVF